MKDLTGTSILYKSGLLKYTNTKLYPYQNPQYLKVGILKEEVSDCGGHTLGVLLGNSLGGHPDLEHQTFGSSQFRGNTAVITSICSNKSGNILNY